MSYASPVSSIADQAERAVASARFSTIGRKFGPRLPISTDYTEVTPDLVYAGISAVRTLTSVMDAHGGVPPGTLCVVLANVIVFLKPDGVAFSDACLNPYAVIHLRQADRLVKSAFVHRDLFHLLANMSGVLQDGSYLESRDGPATLLARVGALLLLSQSTLVGLSYTERKLAGYGGGGSSSWINDAVSGMSGVYARGGAQMLPFYTSGVVGFSGVNFALKVVASDRRPRDGTVYLMGLVPIPVRYSFWFELALGTLITPNGGTFAGHFSGIIAGLAAVYVPRMAGIGALGRGGGGRNRAYAGRGHRLGGRYLRDDEPRDAARGRGSTYGDVSDERRGRRGRGRGNVVSRTLGRLLAWPVGFLKGAVDEGAPLVVHGGFALACVLLQQAMSRHMPRGVLGEIVVPQYRVKTRL